MARPRNEIPTVTVTIRLPEPVAVKLLLRAAEQSTTRSALAARIIADAVTPARNGRTAGDDLSELRPRPRPMGYNPIDHPDVSPIFKGKGKR